MGHKILGKLAHFSESFDTSLFKLHKTYGSFVEERNECLAVFKVNEAALKAEPEDLEDKYVVEVDVVCPDSRDIWEE